MKYTGEMKVDTEVAVEMERLCRKADSSISKDCTQFDREFKFPNGFRMAVQVCSTLDPSEESCWTQGVMFDKIGNELGMTEVGESFLGEYCVMFDGDEYEVNVVAG